MAKLRIPPGLDVNSLSTTCCRQDGEQRHKEKTPIARLAIGFGHPLRRGPHLPKDWPLCATPLG